MAEPIVERIAQALVSRLQKITTSNNYQQTVEVERPKSSQRKIIPRNNLVVVLQDDLQEDAENDVDGNTYWRTWVQPFMVCVFAMPPEDDKLPIEQRINRLLADVIIAIGDTASGDAYPWDQWSGLAIQSRIRPWTLFQLDDGAIDGAELFVEISFRTPENDPYTCHSGV